MAPVALPFRATVITHATCLTLPILLLLVSRVSDDNRHLLSHDNQLLFVDNFVCPRIESEADLPTSPVPSLLARNRSNR